MNFLALIKFISLLWAQAIALLEIKLQLGTEVVVGQACCTLHRQQYVNMDHCWNDNWKGKMKYSKKNLPSMLLCPPQLPHGLHLCWMQASSVRCQCLTTWAVTRAMLTWIQLWVEYTFLSTMSELLFSPPYRAIISLYPVTSLCEFLHPVVA